MSTHKVVTPEMKRNIAILYKNSIPLKLIAELYKITESCVNSNLPEESKNVDLKKEAVPENKLYLLKVYAWLVADDLECSLVMKSPAIIDLKPHLFKHLNLIRWEDFIAGAIFYKNMSGGNMFSPGICEGWKALINKLYPEVKDQNTAGHYLDEVLKKMHNEEIPFPEDLKIGTIRSLLTSSTCEMLLSPKTRESRYFDERFIEYLKIRIGNFDWREKEFVQAKYELSNESKSDLMEKYDVTDAFFELTQRNAISRLSNELNNEHYFICKTVSDYVELWNKLITIQNELDTIKNLELSVSKEARSIETEKTRLMSVTLENLNLPDRVSRLLKKASIQNLFDLVQRTRENLLLIPTLGAWSADCVEQVVRERGLHLGMKFD